jgi:molybdenum cofactor guanylyltransferase
VKLISVAAESSRNVFGGAVILAVKDVSGIILAGGRNTRMGLDKATLRWGDSDMLRHIIQVLQHVCQDIIVVSNSPRPLDAAIRVVADIIPGQGPLSGIHAGLKAAQHHYAFVVGCDMPFIQAGPVRLLLKKCPGWDAVVPVHAGRQQPLHAVYSKACIPVIETLLAEGNCRVAALLDMVCCLRVAARGLPATDEQINAFININTDEDYQQALAHSPRLGMTAPAILR